MPGQLAYALRALGRHDLPPEIRTGDSTFRLEQTIKHDFFAATGFYRDESGTRAVGKFGRNTSFFGLPLAWIGRWLTGRELRFYEKLSDLPNVPSVLTKIDRHGFLHAYVEGNPVSRKDGVPENFFADLRSLLDELHRRHIAYVDTNKPENILLGDDHKPHLIDFQISYDLHALGDNLLNRWILHRLQRADLYHILKHKKRMRPEQMTPEEWEIVNRRGFWIHVHRTITAPYFFVRRRLFRFLRAKGWILPEGSK
jgi:hypothetical protein